MLQRIDRPGGAVRYETDKASVDFQVARGGRVIESKYTGTFDVPWVAPMIAEVERRTVGVTDMVMFVDLSDMKDFTAEFRNGWVEWFRKNQHRIQRAVFLHRSVIIKIGLSIVGVALRGKIESVADHAAYTKECLAYGVKPTSSEAPAA